MSSKIFINDIIYYLSPPGNKQISVLYACENSQYLPSRNWNLFNFLKAGILPIRGLLVDLNSERELREPDPEIPLEEEPVDLLFEQQ